MNLRVVGIGHNLFNVLLLIGVPISILGLLALPWQGRDRAVRPVLLTGLLTFLATSLLFPVATTWGTFLHAAAPVHVLLLISALGALDAGIARLGSRLGWTRPVAWLGPTLAIFASLLFSVVLLPGFGGGASATARTYQVIAREMAAIGAPLDGSAPVIHDFPIWLAETERVSTLALPDETPADVLDLASHFGAKWLISSRAGPRLVARDPRRPGSRCRLLPGGPAADPRRPGRCRGDQGRARVPDRLLRRRAHPGTGISRGGVGMMLTADTLALMDGPRGEPAAGRYDELHAEAADALGFAANTLRGIRDRYRQAYVDEIAQWEALDDDLADLERASDDDVADGPEAELAAEAGAADHQLRVARSDAAESSDAVGRHEAELSRLELAIRNLETTWLFIERGDNTLVTADDLPRAPTELQMRIVEAQEGERVRLAQEVHDGPAQALSNAIFQVEFIDRVFDTDPAMARAELRFLRAAAAPRAGRRPHVHRAAAAADAGGARARRVDRRHREHACRPVGPRHHDGAGGAGVGPARRYANRRTTRRAGGPAECPQARRGDQRGRRHAGGRRRMGAGSPR